MNRNRFIVLTLLAGGAALSIQAQEWRIPIGGVVFDAATNSLRKIVGFPGGAQLSQPVWEGIEWAEVSPDGRRALICTKTGALEWLEGLVGDAPAATRLEPIGEGPYVARWSRESDAIRVYSAECACFQTFARRDSGEPSELGVVQYLSSSVGLVSSFRWTEARTVLAAEKGLYQLEAGTVERLALPAEAGRSFFVESNDRAWAVDAGTGQLSEAHRGADGEWNLRLIAADAERMSGVVGIASERGRIWIADGPSQSLSELDHNTGAVVRSLKVAAGLSGLTRVGGGTVWLIRERTERGQPIYVLDDANAPNVLFVAGGDYQ